jgi:hypothetical protein
MSDEGHEIGACGPAKPPWTFIVKSDTFREQALTGRGPQGSTGGFQDVHRSTTVDSR